MAFYAWITQTMVDASLAGELQRWKELEDYADAPPRSLSRGVEHTALWTVRTGMALIGGLLASTQH